MPRAVDRWLRNLAWIARGRVLTVDWVPSRPERPEGLIVMYDGGVSATKEIEAIIVQDGELIGFALMRTAQVARKVTSLVACRISAYLEALPPGQWYPWKMVA
jgi:8-oxo-dGTP diphosphatase